MREKVSPVQAGRRTRIGFWFLFWLVMFLFPSATASDLELDGIQGAMDRLAMDEAKGIYAELQSQDEGFAVWGQLAVLYNFFADYAEFIEDDLDKSRDFADRAIAAAEEAAAYNGASATLQAVLGDAYARKITGVFTSIRFGGAVTDAIEAAEALDPDNEQLLYVQAKRYMLAPAAFGGDREAAATSFERLTERNPNSSLYVSFLAAAVAPEDPDRARALWERALELAPTNDWAERELADL